MRIIAALILSFLVSATQLAASVLSTPQADSIVADTTLRNQLRSNLTQYLIQGIVRDSLTLDPLEYASVTVARHGTGAITDDHGIFQLTLPVDADTLYIYYPGYTKKAVPVKKNRINMYAIDLTPSKHMLRELVVTKKKYSKKNNPAVDFARLLRNRRDLTDPLQKNPYYNYERYERITLALNNFASQDENSWMFRKFPFLWDHVDTSEISGKPILNISLREKASTVHHRSSPRTSREIIQGIRHVGMDEIIDADNMRRFLEVAMPEVDLYQSDIDLLTNRFVSPLSHIATDFYKFYLTDTVMVDNEKCIVLSFYPHNKASFGFIGQLYVPAADSTMFIKKITMRSPSDINLNFVENLYISQTFERAPDGSRFKTTDDMTVELSMVPGKQGLYARRNVAFKNHNFDAPADSLNLFGGLQQVVTQKDATQRDDDFWHENRQFEITDGENNISGMMQKLRSVPFFYWTEKIVKILVNGYIPTSENSKFDIGPMNTTISGNTVEGMRLRAGGMTTANLSKRWFGRFYVARGFKDHRWKYSTEVEYSFHDKEYHPREFPIHSLRVTSLYDVDMIGQKYAFTNPDNMFLSLKRMPDRQITYHNVNKLDYTLELHNNFSLVATVQHERQHATPFMPFINGKGQIFTHFDETSFTLQLRYAPGEKFYQMKTGRIPMTLDPPVIMLSHTVAPRGMFNSTFTLNKTELSMQKRFWFSAFGYTDIILKGGHVWSVTPYTALLIPNANLSYTIQPESFALLNPMEFINDTYTMFDVTYFGNGILFNLIPGFKKLKLREVVSMRGTWGQLSDKNNPARNTETLIFPTIANVTRMNHGPYMELSAGIENIFKMLRVDYVWRLNYRNVPYPISRGGVRIALHITF